MSSSPKEKEKMQMTKAVRVLSLVAAFSLLVVVSVHAQSVKSKPINNSNLPMTHAQTLKIEQDLFKLSKQFHQVPGNIARMSAQCIAANKNTGMCRVYNDLTQKHDWKGSGGQLL